MAWCVRSSSCVSPTSYARWWHAFEVGLTQDELRTHLATARDFLKTVAHAHA